jgi:hypothetical protein
MVETIAQQLESEGWMSYARTVMKFHRIAVEGGEKIEELEELLDRKVQIVVDKEIEELQGMLKEWERCCNFVPASLKDYYDKKDNPEPVEEPFLCEKHWKEQGFDPSRRTQYLTSTDQCPKCKEEK